MQSRNPEFAYQLNEDCNTHTCNFRDCVEHVCILEIVHVRKLGRQHSTA